MFHGHFVNTVRDHEALYPGKRHFHSWPDDPGLRAYEVVAAATAQPTASRSGIVGYARRAALRCRADSYSTTDAATAAFSELAAPSMGILARSSQASRQATLSPVASLPTSSMVGSVRSTSATSTSPFSSVPTRRTPVPLARTASAQSRTARCEGTRTTGTENSEPVLARTDLGSYTSAA